MGIKCGGRDATLNRVGIPEKGYKEASLVGI
jgi:hypothetical protein